MTPGTLRTLTAALGLGIALSGCMVYPKEISRYDAECKITTHKYVFDVVAIEDPGCVTNDPRACLAIIAAVGPVSAVISGSIVVVGNTLYWLEEEGACLTRTEDA